MVPDRFVPVLEELRPLADRFRAGGHRLYLVGGTVRDLLLGRDGKRDIDATTDARPADTKAVLSGWADAVWTQGERFGTIGARRGEQVYEITTHRAEAYNPDSRKPDVVFADAVEADLARRDFTVNAMALELTSDDPYLVDPHGGAADLAAGTLRTPLSPEESFSDDPLRMLRAARFLAGYHLEPDEVLVDAVAAMHHRLTIVSAERIRDELDKLITVDRPGPGLWFTINTGLAEEFLPELPAMRLEQDPVHRHKDVLSHTIAVVDNVRPDAAPSFDFRRTRLAALFHDVGKPKTRGYRRGKGVTFHHHEVVGARMTRDRLQALRYSTADVEAVTHLVELHLRFHTYRMGWTDSAVRRYVARRRRPPHRAERAHPLRLHHPQRAEGRAPRPPDGRAGGADHGARGPGGAEGDPTGARRQPGDGPAGPEARSCGRGGDGVPPRAAPRRGPARRRGGRASARRLVVGSVRLTPAGCPVAQVWPTRPRRTPVSRFSRSNQNGAPSTSATTVSATPSEWTTQW